MPLLFTEKEIVTCKGLVRLLKIRLLYNKRQCEKNRKIRYGLVGDIRHLFNWKLINIQDMWKIVQINKEKTTQKEENEQ